MAARLQLALAALLGLVAVALGGVLLFGGGSGTERAKAGPSGFFGGVRPEIPPQDFALHDASGHLTRLSDYRGKVVVVTFMYSTCQDTCPVTASQIRGALDDLGRDVPVLAVSVDPAQDTPNRARVFVQRQSLTGRMQFLLGSRAELSRVWRAYGVQPEKGKQLPHSDATVLIDGTGRQRIGFETTAMTPEGLAHDIRRLERAG
jgi:protein SCO1/2